MIYRSVGNRCAVDPNSLRIQVKTDVILAKLIAMGFVRLQMNPVAFAKSCIGVTKYNRGAHPKQAPAVVDCTSFTKWIYGQCGIWLPRYSIQQRECGARVPLEEISVGDVVFTTGRINWYDTNPEDGAGHAGLATDRGTVIHAAGSDVGVIESRLLDFLGSQEEFRGAIRMIPKDQDVWCLEVPPTVSVETSDDLRWILLQRL